MKINHQIDQFGYIEEIKKPLKRRLSDWYERNEQTLIHFAFLVGATIVILWFFISPLYAQDIRQGAKDRMKWESMQSSN